MAGSENGRAREVDEGNCYLLWEYALIIVRIANTGMAGKIKGHRERQEESVGVGKENKKRTRLTRRLIEARFRRMRTATGE